MGFATRENVFFENHWVFFVSIVTLCHPIDRLPKSIVASPCVDQIVVRSFQELVQVVIVLFSENFV